MKYLPSSFMDTWYFFEGTSDNFKITPSHVVSPVMIRPTALAPLIAFACGHSALSRYNRLDGGDNVKVYTGMACCTCGKIYTEKELT